jgi:transposase
MLGFSAAVFCDSRLILEISLMIRDVDLLRDDQWERLREFVPGGCKGKRGPRADNRRFLNALLWMARSGGRWRDLPERLGDYETVKRRYYRWIEMGVLDAVLAALTREADLEWLMIDSTIVRAHQQAGGARREKGGRMPKALAAHAVA